MVRTWVSPRVNKPEPCARGSRPVSMLIGRTVVVIASVGAATFVENHRAHIGFDLIFECFGNVERFVRAGERGNHFFLERVESIRCVPT